MTSAIPSVEIVGHGCPVSARQRAHVIDRIALLRRHAYRIERYEVGVTHELDARHGRSSDLVTITGIGSGFVIRVRGDGSGFHEAFACALSRLESRLQRHRERRVTREHGSGHPHPVVGSTA